MKKILNISEMKQVCGGAFLQVIVDQVNCYILVHEMK